MRSVYKPTRSTSAVSSTVCPLVDKKTLDYPTPVSSSKGRFTGISTHDKLTHADLTGSKPTPSEGSLAGTTHDLPLKTKYYSATVPVWLDLIESPSEWSASFLSPEAGEVLTVLGGIILIFALPSTTGSGDDATRDLIAHVGKVVHEGLGGWSWDGVKLAVGVGGGDADTEEWDELCAEAGLEFVHVGGDDNKLQQFGGP